METALIHTFLETWGMTGVILVAGWFALRWLAQRDDNRNAKMFEIIADISKVVANNTQAMQDMSTRSEMAVSQMARFEAKIFKKR